MFKLCLLLNNFHYTSNFIIVLIEYTQNQYLFKIMYRIRPCTYFIYKNGQLT